MPVALHDSQRDTSLTRSGISDGQITITDQAGQAELTPGKSIEDIIAGLNRKVETGGMILPSNSGRVSVARPFPFLAKAASTNGVVLWVL
ncbi:hypothetical protein BFW38_10680 [Terasakiispira papahanaumokuakeensis]|uniref:Uncharacterized protein n=1 Tax=Terasakiispira papahanaumokuakeensis TaxID=197479 RepID=A0A1E2VAC8_9GAMM|nr:hypothetical protein [Terasakiispira papahanaumokuakeensis]ODC03934.1 hypothetical protein BFW38_10680 [Terasakiispira papahanaumokuakeensis]